MPQHLIAATILPLDHDADFLHFTVLWQGPAAGVQPPLREGAGG